MSAGNSLMRPNQFEVNITNMPAWSDSSDFTGRDVRFYCNEASLPGVSIDTTDQRPYGTGYAEYFPTGVSFPEFKTVFYADQHGDLIKFFHTWQRNIVNFDPSHTSDDLHRVQYRDNYISEVQVTQFSEQGDRILNFTYMEAWPVSVLPIAVRWFSRDEVTEFEVVWKYKVWKESSISSNGVAGSFMQTVMPGLGIPGFASIINGVQNIIGSHSLPNPSSLVNFSSGGTRGITNIINQFSGSTASAQNVIGKFQMLGKAAITNVPALLKSKIPSFPKIF